MQKKYAILQEVTNNRKITREADREFLLHMQQSLLLTLHQEKILSLTVYRHAANQLDQQFRIEKSHHKGMSR